MTETERVLFVHAHPDDESITTGGTIATLVDRGARVTVLTCTRGERGEVIPDDLQYVLSDLDAVAELRECELAQAMAILGVEDHRYLGAPGARAAAKRPRRYLDSGMKWGASGAEAVDELDEQSLTAAEFAEVASDIAAVIADVRPHAIVTYDADGGYGHPDHVLAHEASRRAADAYDVPFFTIQLTESTAPDLLSVDAAAAFDRKRAALERYRSQVIVRGDTFEFSNGDVHPIDRVEKFRRVRADDAEDTPFAELPLPQRVVSCLLALAVGAVAGAILTVFHASTAAGVPIGLIGGLVIIAALLIGTRLAYGTRVVALFAAIGLICAIALLSLESAGGSVLVQANAAGTVWLLAPIVIALVVIAWPQTRRSPPGRIVSSTKAKGTPLQ
jgi:N-acetyl-1-D-myo-inositol-2-amino-2-deoxy-alpha-D-glucopyranoside deacetylase